MSEHPTVAETITELRDLYEHGRSYTVRRVAGQAAAHLARASSLAPVAPEHNFCASAHEKLAQALTPVAGAPDLDDPATTELLAAMDELYPLPDDEKRAERAGRTCFALKRWMVAGADALTEMIPRLVEVAARDRVAPPSLTSEEAQNWRECHEANEADLPESQRMWPSVAPPSGAQTCDCGEKLTQCSSCAVADWQAAHPDCPQCCVTPPSVSPPDVRVIFNNLVRWARSRLSEFEDVPPDIYEAENVISRWSPLPRSTEPEAIRALIAKWRPFAAQALANSKNQKIQNLDRRQCFGVAQAYEQCADELEALVRASSPPPPVSPPMPCPHCGLFGNHLSSCEYERFKAQSSVPPSASGPST